MGRTMLLRISILVFSFSSQFLLAQSQGCLTEGGPSGPNKPCIFPFIFEGKTYQGCPRDLKEPTKTWCSTKVDANGNHVTGQNAYGFCNSFCPKQNCRTVGGPKPNTACVFPFRFDGVEYNSCPVDLEDPTKRWCSTRIDAAGNHVTGAGEFGHCGPDCPIHGTATPIVLRPSCPGNEICRPFIECSAQVSPDEAVSKLCSQAGGSPGVCCKEITELNGENTILKIKQRAGVRNHVIFDNNLLLRSIEIGESAINNITIIRSSSPKIKNLRSPEAQHAMFMAASPTVIERGRFCMIAMEAARSLAKDQNIDLVTDPRSNLPEVDFSEAPQVTGSILQKNCPPQPQCDPRSKYRTIDGSCNNLKNPRFGQVFTPLQRLLPNAYADGLVKPRVAKNGGPLPSTRQITNIAIGGTIVEERFFTSMLVGFGQFVDHDFDHVPISRSTEGGEAIECCTEDGNFREITEDETLCFPIRIPVNDPTLRGTRTCLNFVRSVCSLNLDCAPGPIEQVNQITHWLDSSNVYGSTQMVADSLRTFRDGLLRTEPCENGKECLPFAAGEPTCLGPSRKCALAGDLRVNEQPTLGVLHQLWLREHNRIARTLKTINPRWNDERLYQESRRILNAEYQHIVYNEFIPILLGNKFVQNFNLVPLTKGFSNIYRDDFDPRVANAFAAAAFRIGHTLITSVIKMFKGTILSGSLSLRDVFNNADIIREGNNFEEILAGLTMQPSEAYDTNFVNDVTNELFDDGERGMDLIAINMQRGRDHGLPGYIFYREACGAGPIDSFEDFSNNMTPESIEKLKRAYTNIEDIDLFMGMTHEIPCRGGNDGALIGCTFLCIIGDNFARARLGDRFFYDLPNQPHSFTEAQLNQIRRASLARVICDNTDIRSISPLAFRRPNSETNPITPCKSRLLLSGIPTVDLNVFKE